MFYGKSHPRLPTALPLGVGGWPAPTILGRTIGIDTISHGVLTAVRLPDMNVFQSASYDTLKATQK